MFIFRIVLGIITKKNILEHLEELKQHTASLVTSPQPFYTRDHHTRTLRCLPLRLLLSEECMRLGVKGC